MKSSVSYMGDNQPVKEESRAVSQLNSSQDMTVYEKIDLLINEEAIRNYSEREKKNERIFSRNNFLKERVRCTVISSFAI
jgi:hypothetical protein